MRSPPELRRNPLAFRDSGGRQAKQGEDVNVNPEDNGRLRLAPAYDVVPTNSGQGHQEFACGDQGRDSTLANAMSQCTAFGLTPPEAAAEVAAVIEAVDGWKAHFQRAGVAARDIENLAQRLDADSLRIQRAEFNPAGFTSGPVRPRRRSPFRSD